MAQQRRELSDNLSKADPTGRFAGETVKKQKIQAYKEEISGLEQLVLTLKEEIALLALKLPYTGLKIKKKTQEIVDAEKRIKTLKAELAKLK